MFGLLRGCGGLSKQQHSLWWSHVCGSCVSLGKGYGQVTRFATSFDASVLSLLTSAQSSHTSTTSQVCAFRGMKQKDIVHHDTPAVQFASLITIAMANTKIKDKALDKDTLIASIMPGTMISLSNFFSKPLENHAKQLGFESGLKSITNNIVEHNKIESNAKSWENSSVTHETSLQRLYSLSHSTEASSAVAFAHTSQLAQNTENNQSLHKIGTLFGRIMFLLDNFEDYKYDVRAKRFNALQAAFPQYHTNPDARAEVVKEIFIESHTQLQNEIPKLKLIQQDHSKVINALLVDQLYDRARKIFSQVTSSVNFLPALSKCNSSNTGGCLCKSTPLLLVNNVAENNTNPSVTENNPPKSPEKPDKSDCANSSCCCSACSCPSCGGEASLCGECGSCCSCGECCSCGSCCDCGC